MAKKPRTIAPAPPEKVPELLVPKLKPRADRMLIWKQETPQRWLLYIAGGRLPAFYVQAEGDGIGRWSASSGADSFVCEVGYTDTGDASTRDHARLGVIKGLVEAYVRADWAGRTADRLLQEQWKRLGLSDDIANRLSDLWRAGDREAAVALCPEAEALLVAEWGRQ